MRKEFLFLKKSRWLLFTLLALFAGGMSPAWAQVTESFEDVTLVDPDTYGRTGELSNGWICVNSSGSKYSTGIGSSDSYNYFIGTRGYNSSSKSLGSIASNSNSYYIVIPVLMSGDITFQMCTNSTSSYTYGYVKIHKATDNGDGTYTINSSALSTQTKGGSSSYTWAEKKVSLGEEETMIAICAYRAFIDDFTYTPYVETGCKKPKSLTTSNITFESADLSWTAGEEGQDTWQVVYSTDVDFDKDAATPINVNTTSYSFSNLNDNTTYYAAVRSYCGSGEGEQSAWVTTNFTTPLAPITSFPWTEDFSGISSGIPAGWDNTEGTTTNSSYKWNYYSSGHEGAGLRFNSYNNSSNNTNFLKTPAMNFPAGAAMQLKFWYKNPTGGDFSVYISNDGGATYATELATGLTAASSWTEKVIDIPSEFVNNVVIVFKGTSNCGSGDAYIYLDDVLVKENAAYAWSVSGEDVVSNAIAFGEVKNTSTTKTFTISNDGANALTGVTVVSSDESAFTVSDTNFDIAAGETKDITVTFVKGEVGDYSKTITVSQANIATPIELAVTASYATPSVAVMAVKVGEDAIGETVAFGSVGKVKTKTITVANTGEADLVISSIASNNTTDFTVSPSSLTVQGGSSKTFDITFVWDGEALDAEKTANITVTPSNEGLVAKTFAVTGTRIEQWSEDFSGEADGWEITNGTYWKIQDGVVKGSYSYGNFDLITPSLIVEEGKTMSFDYRMTSTYRSLDIQYSKNNGAWTNLTTISYSGLTQNQWYTYTIEGLEAGKYKFRFSDSNYDLDNFEGFKRNLNDPKLGIYSDAECTAAVATSVTKDFGFATETQTATYYIKNDGTGTMTLALGDAPEGLTQNLDKTSVAAGEKATLTITMPAADNKGYHGGNVVVTATDLGTFTVAASGVVVDENKLNLNFATDNIPSTWTAGNWSKSTGYVSVGYSSTPQTMQTGNLTAEAGETLVVVARQQYTTSSYTFGVKYKKADAEEWSDLIPAANIGTDYVTLRGTIAEAGTYQLQFNGIYTQIQRIYGLSMPLEPVMVVYDGENVAAATYNFGSVANDADAVKTFSVKNEGVAALEGLTATLTGEQAAHYSVAVTGLTDGNLPAGETATVTVTQKKDNLGTHAATLTISATSEGIADKVIALSGTTRDASKLYADFASGIPSGWTATSWSASNGYAQSAYSGTCTLQTPAITVAAGEELTVDLSKYYNNNNAQLKVRYTLDGGITWAEQELNSDLTYGNFTTKTLSLGNAETVTAVLQFVGTYYARLDNFYGGVATTAPMIALTENAAAVENGSTKAFGNLTAEAGTATYTLTNNGTADMVSTVGTTGDVTAEITATTGEKDGNKVTLAAGQTATITVTMAYAAPYAEKSGAMTITSEGWVGDYTVNFTGTTIDPTALYMDFEGNTRPAGWYVENSGWTFTTGTAHVYTGKVRSMITEQFGAETGKNVLSFDAKLQSTYADGELKVYTSTDRKTWTLAKAVTLTAENQAVALNALADGNYYVKFESLNASIDNLTGLKKIVPAPEHDFYVSATTFPTTTLIPETENGVTASVTVNSLRAEETGVFAKLYFDEVAIATTEGQTIAANGSYTFNFTVNVPAEEKTYAAKVIVYNNAEETVWETATADVTVAHTRTLNVTALALGEGQEATAEADASNQFTAKFDVTVENTGSVAVTPTVKIFNGETVVGTATAAEALAKEASTTLTVNAENISAGEGGELNFTAKAYVGEAEFAYATPIVITVTAAAPKFEMAVKGGDAVANNDAVAFGLVKEATTKTYTITNSGNKALELVSIVAPEGYEATELTNENKTIAAAGSLDITVTLKAEQGKKNGNLVITYKVDEKTNNTFTLALTGRSVAADTWTETFDTEIPSAWTNNGWEWNSDRKAAYSTYSMGKLLMTPRLAAEKDEELTFDVIFPYSKEQLKVQYSTDKTTWNDVETYSSTANEQTFEGSFVAPAAGNYYLRFGDANSRYAYIDNLVGFKLNVPDHDTEISASSVPTTGTQYAVYTATVTLKENAGKAEEVTAKLMVAGEEKATKTETITANGTTTITLTWTPDAVIVEAVKAKITVTGTGIDLATEEADLTVAAPYTLDETKSDEVVNDTYPALILKHTFVEGWNTVCLPFNIAVSKLHAEAVAFEFTSYDSSTKELTFTKRTDLVAGTPYVVYVPAAVTTDYVLNNVEITSLNTTAASSTSTPVSFKGTYAPMTAGSLADCFGLTAAGKIVKANSSTTMKGFRGYFTGVPAGASARFIGFIDDELTGIRMITVDQNVEGVFNLQGQKIQQMKKGGLYIINGKKQVVK